MMFTWKDILCDEPIDERRKVADMCCDIEVFRQCRSLMLIPHTEVRVLAGGHHEYSYFQDPASFFSDTRRTIPAVQRLYREERQARRHICWNHHRPIGGPVMLYILIKMKKNCWR